MVTNSVSSNPNRLSIARPVYMMAFAMLGVVIIGLLTITVISLNTAYDTEKAALNVQTVEIEKFSALLEFEAAFGYEGVIHSLKNFVLRGQDRYKKKTQESLNDAELAIARYRSVGELSSKEEAYLVKLDDLVREYTSALVRVGNHELTPSEADQLARVDDTPFAMAVDDLRDLIRRRASRVTSSMNSAIDSGRTRLISISLATIVFSIVLSTLLIRKAIQNVRIEYLRAESLADEVREIQDRFERAVAGTSDGLWDYIPETGDVWYADQFMRLIGLDENEFHNFEPKFESFANLLHPDDLQPTLDAIQAHIEDGEPYEPQYRLRMKNGDYRWFQARGNSIRDDSGTVIRMSGGISDVHEQHEASVALQLAKEQAEFASKSKTEFLANMSHEIRTPMTAILGFADLLQGDLTEDPKQVAHAIQTINSNASHLLTVINDILDVSKIEAGEMIVESIATNPIQIVEEVASLVRPRAVGKGVNVVVRYDSPVPASIQSDPTRLRQILLNLMGNAIKFTEVGSVVLHAQCDSVAEKMVFKVVDSGIGMTPQQCDAIAKFEAFSQADASMTRKFGGSGLGLRISNALAHMLGGKITIESELGQGSTFCVTVATGDISSTELILPNQEQFSSIQKLQPKPAESPTIQSLPLKGIRILLAEDGPDNQKLLNFLLTKAGAQVTICENGLLAAEQIEMATEESLPDVILMDMQMPELDGYGATTRLRNNGCKLPIIALTAHAMEGDRQKCLDAGCDDYLTKPVDKNKLIKSCANWAQKANTDDAALPTMT